MRTSTIVSKLAALSCIVAPAARCIYPGECPGETERIAPGDTGSNGVDPQQALAPLVPQTLPLRWVQINETTTLTITTTGADQPSEAQSGCDDSTPYKYLVPALLTLDTADGRLHTSVISRPLDVYVDAAGALRLPDFVTATLSPSTFVGTGVVSDVLLDPMADFVNVALRVVATGGGFAYGAGSSVVLRGRDNIDIAEVGTP